MNCLFFFICIKVVFSVYRSILNMAFHNNFKLCFIMNIMQHILANKYDYKTIKTFHFSECTVRMISRGRLEIGFLNVCALFIWEKNNKNKINYLK